MMVAVLIMIGAILALSLFSVSLNLSSINRVVMNTPKSIFETSIPILTNAEELDPYFDRELLTSKLTSYYDSNLSRYCKDYTLKLYYYNTEDNSYCLKTMCKAIEVKVTAEIVFNYTYSRTVFYEIQEGAYGN